MSDDGPNAGWTGTILVTAVGAIVIAVLAFAMSGYRDARVSNVDLRPQMSSSTSPDGPGDHPAR
jgi:hypothetical protein